VRPQGWQRGQGFAKEIRQRLSSLEGVKEKIEGQAAVLREQAEKLREMSNRLKEKQGGGPVDPA
jgi:hypothetical protein